MNNISYFILRALCAMLVGFLLVSNPTEMTVLLVQIIGGLFILSGLLAFFGYFNTRRQLRRAASLMADDGLEVAGVSSTLLPMFPVVGVGSMLLGVLLVVWPVMFVNILMYVLGGLLVLVGVAHFVYLISYRRQASIGLLTFLMPVAVVAAGFFVLIKPLETASLPFVILGVAYIVYGVSEFFLGIRFHRLRRRIEAELKLQEARDAEAVEIVESEK